ncbi:MAG: YqgE/AlgH family protein [Alphaproteobacteria bacterium]|nr:YqgE/AlgH family protein [Alphaproteobacteria bacterium]
MAWPHLVPYALAMTLMGSATALSIADTPPLAAEPPAHATSTEPAPGELLIAAATLPDPRFHHAVILVVKHDESGALGIIINRPVRKNRLATVLKEADKAGAEDTSITGDIELYYGGPVEPWLGFLIHSGDYHRAATIKIDDVAAVTADKEALRDIGHRQGPTQYLFAIGYAGWGAGQLEGEVARRDWFTTPADPTLIFDADRAKLWETALARRTQDL